MRIAFRNMLHFIMESQAHGCETIFSGKLGDERSKGTKFVYRVMDHSGDPVKRAHPTGHSASFTFVTTIYSRLFEDADARVSDV